ncbi:MAG: YbaB/EbfC family nucleoid-associated protein [Calditrichaeota bacterium]|nr:MAG: YbaB/EbfC family nucleoid-associated protein [Calditrichota bacterium]
MAKGNQPDFGQLLKQAQKMQQEMQKNQEKLADVIVEGISGGGMVKVKVNGKQEVLEIKIDPEVVEAGDVELVEDLVLTAVNQAMQKANGEANDSMSKLAGNFMPGGLPGGMKLPF